MYREDTITPLPPDRSVLVVGMHGKVFGLDRATGALRWENGLPGGWNGEVFLAIGYGVVIASADAAMIYCLDYLTGVERWSASTSSSGRASILIEADCIVCAKAGYVDCFAPDGQVLWKQPLTGKGAGKTALGFPGNVAQADEGQHGT